MATVNRMTGAAILSVGLIMPISTAIVSDFFEGEKAMQMMGWISASNNFGGMAAQIISGALATLCWRYAFAAYALAFVAIAMVFLYLPEPARKTRNPKVPGTKLPMAVYLCAGAMFVLMLVFYTVPVNLALFIEKNDMGTATSAGVAMAMVSSMMFLGQFSSPIIIDTLGKHWLPHSQASPFLVACGLSMGAAVLAGIQVLITNRNNKHQIEPKEI